MDPVFREALHTESSYCEDSCPPYCEKLAKYTDTDRALTYRSGGKLWGSNVELRDGTFLRIVEIRRLPGCSGTILLRGHHFILKSDSAMFMPSNDDELFWDVDVLPKIRGRDPFQVCLEEVIRFTKIVLTNRNISAVGAERHHGRLLQCKWKCSRELDTDPVNGSLLRRLREDECDDVNEMLREAPLMTRSAAAFLFHAGRVPDAKLQAEWRGEKTAGCPNVQTRSSRYSFGDAFCGAGGTSHGASMAGLRVKWGFDFDHHACRTMHLNFPTAKVYAASVDEFIEGRIKAQVDILHMSSPCQGFSAANAKPNLAQNEDYLKAFFTTGLLVDKCKPRLVTLENVKGLVDKHKESVIALISLFTSRNYSVRWRVLNLANYGVPQTRERFFMIASCPGEPLPSYPTATHSKRPTLHGHLPWVTVNDVIANIRPHPNHDLKNAIYGTLQDTFDGNRPAPTVMASRGSHNRKHPSERRRLTVYEYACLQAFPHKHTFPPFDDRDKALEQIGNAVPPKFAEVLFKVLREALEREDRRRDRRR